MAKYTLLTAAMDAGSGATMRSIYPGWTSNIRLETAAAAQSNVAAAELDHFRCAKIGTQTVLAKSPTLDSSAKRDLTVSSRIFDVQP